MRRKFRRNLAGFLALCMLFALIVPIPLAKASENFQGTTRIENSQIVKNFTVYDSAKIVRFAQGASDTSFDISFSENTTKNVTGLAPITLPVAYDSTSDGDDRTLESLDESEDYDFPNTNAKMTATLNYTDGSGIMTKVCDFYVKSKAAQQWSYNPGAYFDDELVLIPILLDDTSSDRAYIDSWDYNHTIIVDTDRADYKKYWGFPEFAKLAQNEGCANTEEFFEWATSDNNSKKYSIVLKFNDGNNSEEYTLSNYSTGTYNYDGSIYADGTYVGYSRLEDLQSYRGSEKDTSLLSYKGDLYESIQNTNDSLTLPLDNNTNLKNINSVYVDGYAAYAESSPKIKRINGLNYLGTYAEPLADNLSKAEYVKKYMGLFLYYGSDRYSIEDHQSDYVSDLAYQTALTNLELMQDNELDYSVIDNKLYHADNSSISEFNEVTADTVINENGEQLVIGNTDLPTFELRQSQLPDGSTRNDVIRNYISYLNKYKEVIEQITNPTLKEKMENQRFSIRFTDPATNVNQLIYNPYAKYGIPGAAYPYNAVEYSENLINHFIADKDNNKIHLHERYDYDSQRFTKESRDGTYPYFIRTGYKAADKGALVYGTFVHFDVSTDKSKLNRICNKDDGTPVSGLDYYYYDDGTSDYLVQDTEVDDIFGDTHSYAELMIIDSFIQCSCNLNIAETRYRYGSAEEKAKLNTYSIDEVIGILTVMLQNTADDTALNFISQFVPVNQPVLADGSNTELNYMTVYDNYNCNDYTADVATLCNTINDSNIDGHNHYGFTFYKLEKGYGINEVSNDDKLTDIMYDAIIQSGYLTESSATGVDYSTSDTSVNGDLSKIKDGDIFTLDKTLFNQDLGYENKIRIDYYAERGLKPSLNYYVVADENADLSYYEALGLFGKKIHRNGKLFYEFYNCSVNDVPDLEYCESFSGTGENGIFTHFIPTNSYLYTNDYATVIFADKPDTPTINGQTELFETVDNGDYELAWDKPADNGAEIIGYKVAVVSRGSKVEDDDWNYAYTYEDINDTYKIRYSTDKESYTIPIVDGEEYDVYVKAINVIGDSDGSLKITLRSKTSCGIDGPDVLFRTQKNVNYDTKDREDVTDPSATNVESNFSYNIPYSDDANEVASLASVSEAGEVTPNEDSTESLMPLTSLGKSNTDYANNFANKIIMLVDLNTPDGERGKDVEVTVSNGKTDVTDDYDYTTTEPTITITNNKVTIPADFSKDTIPITATKKDDNRTTATTEIKVTGTIPNNTKIEGPDTVFRNQKDVNYDVIDPSNNNSNIEDSFDYSVEKADDAAITVDGKLTPKEDSKTEKVKIIADGKDNSSHKNEKLSKDISVVDLVGPDTGKKGDELPYKVLEGDKDVTDQYDIVPTDPAVKHKDGTITVPDDYDKDKITVVATEKDDDRTTISKDVTITGGGNPTPPNPNPKPSTPGSGSGSYTPTPTPSPTPSPTPTPDPTPDTEKVVYEIRGADEIECGTKEDYELVPTTTAAITWEITGDNGLTTAIDDDGTLTCDDYEDTDVITIIVRDAWGNKLASKDVTVIRNITVEIEGEDSVVKGKKSLYSATVAHSLDGVKWGILESSDEGTTITAQSDDLEGLLRVALTEPSDEIEIVATSIEDPDVFATKTVELIDPPSDGEENETLVETGDNYNPLIFIVIGIFCIVIGVSMKRKKLQ